MLESLGLCPPAVNHLKLDCNSDLPDSSEEMSVYSFYMQNRIRKVNFWTRVLKIAAEKEITPESAAAAATLRAWSWEELQVPVGLVSACSSDLQQQRARRRASVMSH